MSRNMPMKFQTINLMTTLSTRTNILTVIKTFALDIDTVACNEFNIVPSIGFLIYPILPDPPTLPGYEFHHESIIQQNCSEKTSQHRIRHPLVSYFDRLSIGENIACESQGANLPKGIRKEN